MTVDPPPAGTLRVLAIEAALPPVSRAGIALRAVREAAVQHAGGAPAAFECLEAGEADVAVLRVCGVLRPVLPDLCALARARGIPLIVVVDGESEGLLHMGEGAFDYLLEHESDERSVGRAVRRAASSRRAAADASAAATRLRVLFESTHTALVLAGLDGRIHEANDAFHRLSGLTRTALDSTDLWALLETDPDSTQTHQTFTPGLPGRISAPATRLFCRNDGTRVPVAVTSIGVAGPDGEPRVWYSIEDRARERATRRHLEQLSLYDPLTGLGNRHLFQQALSKALSRTQRNEELAALLFFDLDRFKVVNDTLGHDVGDELLRGVARRVTECLRNGDVVARLGGDEFAIILEGLAAPNEAAIVARKVIRSLSTPFDIQGHEVFASPSIGIACFPTNAKDADALVRCADTAMYRAKEMGGSSYRFYSSEVHAEVARRANLETRLRKALPEGEFALHYQPVFDLRTGGVAAYEALLRWRDPEAELVSPAEMVALLDEAGLMTEVGPWILREACTQVRTWQQQFGHPELRVQVNLSRKQLATKTLADTVQQALATSGLAPACLELDIAEEVLAEDAVRAVYALERLAARGVRLAVDDFGVGAASIDALAGLPLHLLKVDRQFIRDMRQSAQAQSLVRACIALGHGLGLEVCAEGVETGDELDRLAAQGCDLVQGFFFGPAEPADLAVRWLAETAGKREGTTTQEARAQATGTT